MQDLWPPRLPIPTAPITPRPLVSISLHTRSPSISPNTIRMMTMSQRLQNLHKVPPHALLRNRPPALPRVLDDGGQIAPAAVLHEDVEDAGVAVDEAVVVPDDVFVVQVFEDVSVGWEG